MKHWTISYSRDGFSLQASESRRIGLFLGWLLDQDPCWWGEYKNLPFCLINPWGWTYLVGTEDRSLGTLWCDFGQWLHMLAWRMEKETFHRVPLTDEQAEKIDPQFFLDMKSLKDDDEA